VNGLFIGAGITMSIVGSVISLTLNAIYWQQTNLVSSQGLNINSYVLSGSLFPLISLSVFMAIFGAYTVILGTINQLSVTARAAWERKDAKARLGNGLITGGFVFVGLSSIQLIDQFYQPYYSNGVANTEIVFIVGGLVLILIGALLIRSSYLRSLRTTKV
jgi:hypothetical protein